MTPLEPIQLSLWGDDPAPAPRSEVPTSAAPTDGRSAAVPLDVAGHHEPSVCTLPCFRHPLADREIRLGKAIIAYEFKRAHRRSIGMVVGPEGLSVRAPRWVSVADVEAALRSKEQWLCKKLLEQRERVQREAQARIEWVDGGLVPFLGQPRRLVLQPDLNGVALSADERNLLVGLVPQATPAQVKDQVHAWLQREARHIFAARVAHFAQRLGVTVTRISLSSARTRWGSASADGSIRLHWSLVHFSQDIVDYVVTHELAHLREMNHSLRFWEVVRSVLPDYDEPRQSLRRLSVPQ